MHIPLADVASDVEHHRRCDSPWYPALRRLAARGKLPMREHSALLAPMANGGGVEAAPARVLAAMEEAVARREAPFLARLSPETRRGLAAGGLLFEVDSGVNVITEAVANSDVFVILEGEFEVRMGQERMAVLGPRDVFGEGAFFVRAASARPRCVLSLAAACCTCAVGFCGGRRPGSPLTASPSTTRSRWSSPSGSPCGLPAGAKLALVRAPRIEARAGRPELAFEPGWGWIASYTVWNACFVYGAFTHAFGQHLAVLAAALLLAMRHGPASWLLFRTTTLGLYLVVYDSLFGYIRFGFDTASWRRAEVVAGLGWVSLASALAAAALLARARLSAPARVGLAPR